ncbi:MAG: type II secretion system F family protein [Candidatus Methanosuratincola petrocarbonis]
MTPEGGSGLLARISSRIASRICLSLYQGELGVSPDSYGRKIALTALLSSALSSVPAVLLALRLCGLAAAPPELLLAAGAAALSSWAIPAYLSVRPALSALGRRRACERELPFLTAFLAIASASGVPIQAALERLRHSAFLNAFRNEAQRIEKVRRLYALHPYDALIFEARQHPSERVRDLYFSVVAAQRQGDAVPSVLRDELMKVFSHLQGTIKTLSDKFSMIASAEMIAFILVPMGALTLGTVFSSAVSLPTLLAACIGLPSVTAVLLSMMIDSSLPKELTTPVPLKAFSIAILALPLGVALAAIFWAAGIPVPPYLAFGAVLLPSLAAASLYYRPMRREVSQILAALPAFTRLVAEEVKKGSSPGMSIIHFSEARAFNQHFDRFLHRISAFLKIGIPVSEVAEAVRAPWVVKAAFELIDESERMGSEPKSLDHLSELVSNLALCMKALSSQTRLFTAVSYMNTLVLTFTTVVAVDVIGRLFAGALGSVSIGLPFGLSFMTGSQFELAAAVAYLAVIYDSFLLGIVGGKLSRGGSVADGLVPAAICVALSIAGFLAFRELGLIRLVFGV